LGFEEKVIHGLGALLGVFGQATHDEVFDSLREGWEVRGEDKGGDGVVNVFEDNLNGGAAVEGRVAGEALIHDNAEGIQVAARVGLAALALLRGHIGGGADEHAGLRNVMAEVEGTVVGEGFDEAKVEDFHQVRVAVGVQQHNVGGLQVPMDDTHAMGLAQGAGDLLGNVEDSGPREGTLSGEDLGEGAALEKLKGNIEGAVGGGAIVNDGDGVGVVQFGRHGGFSKEALAQRVIDAGAVGGVQNFEGDGAVEAYLDGAVNAAHAADSDEVHNPKTSIQGDAHIGVHIGVRLFVVVVFGHAPFSAGCLANGCDSYHHENAPVSSTVGCF